MGDRGNIVVKMQPAPIFLYTHWRGSDIHKILKTALKKKWRWNDEQYLARIIFCELTKDAYSDETGYGISSSVGDNEHPFIAVNCEDQTVSIYGEDDPLLRVPYKTWSMAEYITLRLPKDINALFKKHRGKNEKEKGA